MGCWLFRMILPAAPAVRRVGSALWPTGTAPATRVSLQDVAATVVPSVLVIEGNRTAVPSALDDVAAGVFAAALKGAAVTCGATVFCVFRIPVVEKLIPA